MRTDRLTRILLVGLTILSVIGCTSAVGSAEPSAGSSSSPASALPPADQPASPAPDAPSTPPDEAGTVPEAWLVVGRRGEPGIHVVIARTGEMAFDLPAGAPRSLASWGRLMSATADGAGTIVRDTLIEDVTNTPEVRLDGHWRLPTVGLEPIPAGRSLDGSTAVLVEDRTYDPSAGRSRFAIVEHQTGNRVSTDEAAELRVARIVELHGAFEFDALSPDGRILYVVEHLDGEAGGHYQVRAVDVATGVMRDGVIVDKTHPDESMAGSPIAQVRRPNGLVLTLYRGPEHPFIHALNSTDAWAVCIDLPAGGTADDAASLDWGLVNGSGDLSVFAVNASLGLAVEVDPGELAVRRSAAIGTTAAAPIVLAKFGHSEVGATGRRLVPSPDGKLLFAGGANGVTVIRVSDLAAVRTDLAGSAIEALGITPDGSALFALLRGTGRIVAVDPATGRELGTVPGEGFDRLLAVAPW
jgi:hypothetical protein